MPWLVVTGTGSYGITLGRVWKEPENDLAQGRFEYDIRTWVPGKYEVTEKERAQAEEEGYPPQVIFFEDDDEPELLPPDDSGILKPEDIRSGIRRGVRLAGQEPEPEAEPVIDPEGMPLDFPCLSCERAFPSEGSLERHVEFDHTRRHEVTQARAQREAERKQQEKDELKRLEDTDGPLPVWEREAVEQHVKPSNEG